MKENMMLNPEYYFEVSWEVCNKVGGIYTVIATKALNMVKGDKFKHILIGPDIWRSNEPNPDFTEDTRLFKSWREKAQMEGLKVKVGRWNIAGNPIVILVDFSQYVTEKDAILTQFWDKYQLDSITGQWDYIEPALFGYASGRVIESFLKHSSTSKKCSIAQFHEWMTGTGVLHLKSYMPQIGTIFTTHATVLGRCAAGNNLPLYSELSSFNPDELARHFNVVAKYSLEKCSAENADCFTTVSDITARECAQFLGKPVDIVTPNGFELNFTPVDSDYQDFRNRGREKFIEVAEAVLGGDVSSDALLVGISGRYEYKNKGIDIFMKSLERLNTHDDLKREIIAFVLIPAGCKGVNHDVLNNINSSKSISQQETHFSTHTLENSDGDPVMQDIERYGLTNKSNVKVIFVPCYLNGNDGIFNMPYYDLLIGLDLAVFPSYYEPWGYTPLESLAFKIPTITTTLAGFGLWVNDYYKDNHSGIEVINRDDYNSDYVVDEIVKWVDDFARMGESQMRKCMDNAYDISKIALWENQIEYYYKAVQIALNRVSLRFNQHNELKEREYTNYIETHNYVNNPQWRTIMINKHIPENLIALEKLSKNLWWCWNEEARELFRMLDEDKWREVGHNPVALLDKISLSRYKELEDDKQFMSQLGSVYKQFTDYMNEKEQMTGPGVAYLCMEYALHSSLKIYSGGLGVLAGDYLKEASDKGVKLTAVGLLYRYGYFTQQLSSNGAQEAKYEAQDFMKLPASPLYDENNIWKVVTLSFPGRTVYARIWKVEVGRVDLYLLDTDFEDNIPEDRSITHHLYGGDWENRLKQELLLGCGGIEALNKIGVNANIYHYNEGHAAFAGLKRLEHYIQSENLTFAEAVELVRASSLFTTHTPVPAGHDFFTEDILRVYISHLSESLKISWKQLMSLGKIDVDDNSEKFSMSFLAARLSQEVNGVSWLHGEVSKDIFKKLWPGYFPEELHVSYVTNGVHYPTWCAPEWKEIGYKMFGEEFKSHHYDKSCFNEIYKLPNIEISSLRKKLRSKLISYIKERIDIRQTLSYFTPSQVVDIRSKLRDDVLTIGFARRFATYKRAHLLFTNLDKLNELVNHPERPVQFVFAGKAHPADRAGQDLIKKIVSISKMPQFIGKILFLPNYDMDLGKYLVSGVDIWMNTPTRPLEASGTSGEKAAMNGVMHFSVLDGWWVEGYEPDAGWMLPQERVYENQDFQDELDAETIYHIIENDIVKKFYDEDGSGISDVWVSYIKNTIAKVASNFTTNRMLDDYENKFYIPLGERSAKLKENNNSMALDLASWKQKIANCWDLIEMVDYKVLNQDEQVYSVGNTYTSDLVLYIGDLDANDIGVELVVSKTVNGINKINAIYPFTLVGQEDSKASYKLETIAEQPGLLQFALRVYPKNANLPHRQDFALVKWF